MRKKIFGIIICLLLIIPVITAVGMTQISIGEKYATQILENDVLIELEKAPLSNGVNLIIKNQGLDILTDINWNFRYKTSISGQGLLFNEKTQNGLISTLDPGQELTYKFRSFNNEKTSPIGFGNIYLNASVSVNGELVRAQQRVFLFSFLTLLYKDTYMDVFPNVAYNMIQNEEIDVIIDVSSAYDEGHLPGAINYYIGDGSLDDAIPSLDKNLNYLVYCHVDSASVPGAQKLVDAGIENVYRLEGNIGAWIDAGYPIEGGDGSNYIDIDVHMAKELIDTNPDLIVIDVSPYYNEGHIPGAVNYYLGDGSLDEAIPTLDKNKDYLVYCHADGPSITGAQKLVDAGFNPVYRLEGNFQAWVDAGYPVEP